MKSVAIPLISVILLLICSLNVKAQESGADVGLQDTIYIIDSTDIAITPPVEFKPFDQIHGFIHMATSSTIQVNQIEDAPYLMIVENMTDDHFASQGVTLLSQFEINEPDAKGYVYVIGFTIKGVDFERIMYFTGDLNRTIWINANYPVMIKPLIYNAMLECVKTAHFVDSVE
ncbi:MAG: hypothetical protein C0594_07105 [Marinilabiliales bacterium]|nr:MAG: hypothetical protein C0594_07105 [Marinilabiliales bacterium]